jgi:ribosomal protein S26
MSNEADFYRMVMINGLYNKSSGNTKDAVCTNCATSIPKELRFCVKVFAVKTHIVQAEICSMMTNFRE